MKPVVIPGLMAAVLCAFSAPALAQTVPATDAVPPPAEAMPAPDATPTMVLVMDKAGQDEVVKGLHPTSHGLSMRSISFPIGATIRDTALEAFKPVFAQPAFARDLAVSDTPQAGAYNLVVRNAGFSYAVDFDMSGNMMSFTPAATLSVVVNVVDPSGNTVFTRTYARDDVSHRCEKGAKVPKEVTGFETDMLVYRVKQSVYCSYVDGLKDIYTQAAQDIRAAVAF